jgi:hypothetical protein
LLACLRVSACALWFWMMPPWIDIPTQASAHDPTPPLLSTRDPAGTVGLKR